MQAYLVGAPTTCYRRATALGRWQSSALATAELKYSNHRQRGADLSGFIGPGIKRRFQSRHCGWRGDWWWPDSDRECAQPRWGGNFEELALIQGKGIRTIPFHSVLASLCAHYGGGHKGGAGTDIAEMIAYYVKNHRRST